MTTPYTPATYFTDDHAICMLLRDYFAAKAMQSLLIDPRRDNAFSDTAKYAYLMADQMLEARK
jgi:hypothetical protein